MIKVTGLSADNVRALRQADEAHVTDGVELDKIGATFAVFQASTPADALAMVQADMDHLRATSPGGVRQTRYQALIAVRNKLRCATVGPGTNHVKEA